MESVGPSIVQRLQRLRALRSRPFNHHNRHHRRCVVTRRCMDALVHDLSHALEESSPLSLMAATSGNPAAAAAGGGGVAFVAQRRRARGWRRRSRSSGNMAATQPAAAISEDSSSSVGDTQTLSTERQLSSVRASDSDERLSDAGVLSHVRRNQRHRAVTGASDRHTVSLVESDSFNENSMAASQRLHKRQKRRLKRMSAAPVMAGPSRGSIDCDSTAGTVHSASLGTVQRKRFRIHNTISEHRCVDVILGKRKCSSQSESACMPPPPPSLLGTAVCQARASVSSTTTTTTTTAPGGVEPDCHMDEGDSSSSAAKHRPAGDFLSSSSLSSGGDSDTCGGDCALAGRGGAVTNDEGREGDDEQSDWLHESQDELVVTTLNQLHVKPERQIMGARRRLRCRRSAQCVSAMSSLSALTQRVAQFVQCGAERLSVPQWTHSWLAAPGGEHVRRLAQLYNLNISRRPDGSVSALHKTSGTRGACSAMTDGIVASPCADRKRYKRCSLMDCDQ